MKLLRKYHFMEGDNITPWENDEKTAKPYNYFNQIAGRDAYCLPRKKNHFPNLKCRVYNQLNQREESHAKTLEKQSTRKSLREVNIEFHPRNHSTITHHRRNRPQKERSQRISILHDQSIRNQTTRGQLVSRQGGKKRESTYILKQKFAKIKRSMVLKGEDKENLFRKMRYN